MALANESPGCPHEPSQVLQDFRRELEKAGYLEFLAAFNPIAFVPQKWHDVVKELPSSVRALVELCLFSQSVEPSQLGFAFHNLVPPLKSLGVLQEDPNGYIHTGNLILIGVAGLALFVERPSFNPTLYYGDDSYALLNRLRPKMGGDSLDLCSGPGTLALYSARVARYVSAVEINPLAAALCQINAQMNGMPNVEVMCGDLCSPVVGRRYDHISANPPLLPVPAGVDYPFVGHGGEDGLSIVWRILESLPSVLKPDGSAQIIGIGLSDGRQPLMLAQLESWLKNANARVILSIIAHISMEPGSAFFERLVLTAAGSKRQNGHFIAEQYQVQARAKGASHFCTYFMHVTLGESDLTVLNLSTIEKDTLDWYI